MGVRLGISGGTAVIFITLAADAIRVAEAEAIKRGSNWTDLGRAARLAPLDAAIARATFLGATGFAEREARGAAELDRAIALNPRDARNWIDLAFAAETRGDMKAAESDLQNASRVNRMYDPAWALANFYLRRGRTEECLRWTYRAAAIADRDLTALFDLCWHTGAGVEHILNSAIPVRAKVLSAYLSYLLGHNRMDAAEQVAGKLAVIADGDSKDGLLAYCDRVLSGRPTLSSAPALAIWNTMARRRFIPAAPLDPALEAVTNPTFTATRIGHGFDWIAPEIEGVSIAPATEGWSVQFSGKQPEDCDLLEQRLPVEEGAAYSLRTSYRVTPSSALPTGIFWMARDMAGSHILARGPDLNGEQRTESAARLPPSRSNVVRLVLHYTRPLGVTRFEGTLVLYAVHVARDGTP